jgi:hypothetical protein
MPRTFNPQAADLASSQGPPSNGANGNRNFRVTHKADPVPDENPLEYGGVSARHITPSYYISSGNSATPTLADVAISSRNGTSETLDPPYSIAAHLFYFNRISACY